MQTDICDAEPHKIKSSFTASWKMLVSLIDVTLNREQAIIFPAAKLTDPVRDGRDLRPSQNSGAGARRTTSTYNANKTSQRNTDHMRRIICQHPIPLIFFYFFFIFISKRVHCRLHVGCTTMCSIHQLPRNDRRLPALTLFFTLVRSCY